MADGGRPRAADLPAPTRDLQQAFADIADFGLAIIPDVLVGDALARVRTALYRAADDDRTRGREAKFSLDYESDNTNQRVWNVLSRDAVFSDLVEHPIALALVRQVLGWPALLGNISANITGPGGGEMVLHADQIFVPEPWPAEPQGFNVAWCVDDFTEETGATRIVPFSHTWNRAPTEAEADITTIPVEASAGSIVVFESRVWHKTGNNRSADKTRAGIFGWYTKPIYRTQENWFLSLDPSVRRFASEDMQWLLAFKSEGFGLVWGASPQ